MAKAIHHRFYRVKASALNDNHKRVNGVGHVCVVLVQSTKNPKLFKAAVSFKSPADRAQKRRGFEIASGRLRSTKPGRNFRVTAKNYEAALSETLDKIFAKTRKVYRHGKKVARPFAPDWLWTAVVKNERVLTPLL